MSVSGSFRLTCFAGLDLVRQNVSCVSSCSLHKSLADPQDITELEHDLDFEIPSIGSVDKCCKIKRVMQRTESWLGHYSACYGVTASLTP